MLDHSPLYHAKVDTGSQESRLSSSHAKPWKLLRMAAPTHSVRASRAVQAAQVALSVFFLKGNKWTIGGSDIGSPSFGALLEAHRSIESHSKGFKLHRGFTCGSEALQLLVGVAHAGQLSLQ